MWHLKCTQIRADTEKLAQGFTDSASLLLHRRPESAASLTAAGFNPVVTTYMVSNPVPISDCSD